MRELWLKQKCTSCERCYSGFELYREGIQLKRSKGKWVIKPPSPWSPWRCVATTGKKGGGLLPPLFSFAPFRAPLTFVNRLWHPNSEFESTFGLWTVTQLCMMKTMKLWQLDMKLTWYTTTKTMHCKRMKSSVTSSFELEIKWVSNRNDRNSTRNHIKSYSSSKQ